MTKISPTGFWIGKAEAEHLFDLPLCNAITQLVKNYHQVYDLGCGNASYTLQLRKLCIDTIGFDGNPDAWDHHFPWLITTDLAKPIHNSFPKADAVLCLEVGEHIPEQFQHTILDNVFLLASNLVILSWAIEGQGGLGHVNCKNNQWVEDQASQRGWILSPNESHALRSNSSLEWFKHSLMVFRPSKQ